MTLAIPLRWRVRDTGVAKVARMGLLPLPFPLRCSGEDAGAGPTPALMFCWRRGTYSGSCFYTGAQPTCAEEPILALRQRSDRAGIRHSRRCVMKAIALQSHFGSCQHFRPRLNASV